MRERGDALHTSFRVGPGDREAGYYRYVPLEVPAGAPGVSVSLRYDRSRAVIDLGLFDAVGFRGWSGGERSDVTVGADRSTPGYLSGPLPPGEWLVALGLYALPAEGVDVTVSARLEAPVLPDTVSPPPPPRPAPTVVPPAAPGCRWVAGDLHAHTVHSDGRLSVDELAALAVERGLDFLAVTDHNTVSHHPLLAGAARHYGVTLIAGQEVTTPDGHANCFGPVGWIDFREEADAWVQHAHGGGGILSVNHPLAWGCSWNKPLSGQPDMMELWHKTWDRRSRQPAERWRSFGAPVPVGGSDFHHPDHDRLGAPTTWVEVHSGDGALPSPGEVLAGLAAGRVAISAGPDAPVLVADEDGLVACGADGTDLVHEEGQRMRVTGDRFAVAARPGLWTLQSAAGDALALCAVD